MTGTKGRLKVLTNVVEAKQRLGYEPLDWLGIPASHRKATEWMFLLAMV